jgi:hypothetical protein
VILKSFFSKAHWVIRSQFGIDIKRFIDSLRGIPGFISDWRSFRENYSGRMDFKPCLYDRFEEGGSTKDEYFWQDLLVARMVYAKNPKRHVDIGSRVDGFVAHVASFREIEVFDVRPISTLIPGVVFKQADLMNPVVVIDSDGGYCDSLSCLHAIEHFGLGRYGDPINPLGYQRGIENMASLLKVGGYLYISMPIGIERVDFNANRVFHPRTIRDCANSHGLVLKQLTVISSNGQVVQNTIDESTFSLLSEATYNLGIFIFEKSI